MRARGGGTIAVAGAEGEAVLEAVKIGKEDGILHPILVGDKKKIEAIAEKVRKAAFLRVCIH